MLPVEGEEEEEEHPVEEEAPTPPVVPLQLPEESPAGQAGVALPEVVQATGARGEEAPAPTLNRPSPKRPRPK